MDHIETARWPGEHRQGSEGAGMGLSGALWEITFGRESGRRAPSLGSGDGVLHDCLIFSRVSHIPCIILGPPHPSYHKEEKLFTRTRHTHTLEFTI